MSRARWRGLVLGRAIPMAAFGAITAAEADRVRGVVAVATRPGAGLPDRLSAADGVLVVVYYCLLVALYLVRLPQRSADRRPLVVAASLAGSFAVMVVPFLPPAPRRDWLLLPADVVALAGIAGTIWSVLYLSRSFSILPQARRLVTSGPYALSRNPLYLGEMASSWALFLPTLGWAGALALTGNVALQLVRVHAEERVLSQTFGAAYDAYRARVPRFLPLPGMRTQ